MQHVDRRDPWCGRRTRCCGRLGRMKIKPHLKSGRTPILILKKQSPCRRAFNFPRDAFASATGLILPGRERPTEVARHIRAAAEANGMDCGVDHLGEWGHEIRMPVHYEDGQWNNRSRSVRLFQDVVSPCVSSQSAKQGIVPSAIHSVPQLKNIFGVLIILISLLFFRFFSVFTLVEELFRSDCRAHNLSVDPSSKCLFENYQNCLYLLMYLEK